MTNIYLFALAIDTAHLS